MIPIPVWTYERTLKARHEEYLRAVDSVLCGNKLILGPNVAEFEDAFASWLGRDAVVVGVSNGTDALSLALLAVGARPGHSVVTVPNTAVPTVAAIRAIGASPVFVDTDPETGLIDMSLLERFVGITQPALIKAVVPVHLYGRTVDMDALMTWAELYGVSVVEDCAQAHGSLAGQVPVGLRGDIGAFSFYPTKILGAFGDAGACVTRSASFASSLRALRMYGMREGYYSEMEGRNCRLDEMQAALLLVQLRHLEEDIAARVDAASLYDRMLRGLPIQIPKRSATDVPYLYEILVEGRDAVMESMSRLGVETKAHFGTPIHLMRGYSFLGYAQGDFPNAEAWCERVLSLPLFPGITKEEQGRVASALEVSLHAA